MLFSGRREMGASWTFPPRRHRTKKRRDRCGFPVVPRRCAEEEKKRERVIGTGPHAAVVEGKKERI